MHRSSPSAIAPAPTPGLPELLARIATRAGTRVAVVTGRRCRSPSATSCRSIPPVEVWGLHGRERLHADGRRESWPVSARARAGLTQAAAWARASDLADRIEEKDGALAFHFRDLAAADSSAELARGVAVALAPLALDSGLDLRAMAAGLELREPGRDKGDAVTTLLGEMAPGGFAVYLGDDDTDEDAFAAIAGRGVGVLVRETWRPTRATAWLRPPAGLVVLLAAWAELETP